jgi:LysM repeat protein
MLRRTLASALLCLVLPSTALADRGPTRLTTSNSRDDDAEPTEPARSHGPTHKVARGETLSAIVARYGMSLADVVAHNPGLDPDRVREGQEIFVGPTRPVLEHVVARGETLTSIATRYATSVADILRANKGLSPDRVRAGQKLRVWSEGPTSRSESIGSPAEGKLAHARVLPPHPGYEIRTRERAFGTDETVHALVSAFDELRRKDPKAPKLAVHDLSLPHGGPIDDHRSHQSGRDVDLAFFQQGCATRSCDFRTVNPDTLDAKRTWALLSHWLERNRLEAVFIDYDLQGKLYAQARAQGATAAQLSRWFQYPHGRSYPLGIIRHVPKHRDHIHARFACHESDAECMTLRPLIARGGSKRPPFLGSSKRSTHSIVRSARATLASLARSAPEQEEDAPTEEAELEPEPGLDAEPAKVLEGLETLDDQE